MHVQESLLWKLAATEDELGRLRSEGADDEVRRRQLRLRLDHLHADLVEARQQRRWELANWVEPAARAWFVSTVVFVAVGLLSVSVLALPISTLHLGVFPCLVGGAAGVYRARKAIAYDRSQAALDFDLEHQGSVGSAQTKAIGPTHSAT